MFSITGCHYTKTILKKIPFLKKHSTIDIPVENAEFHLHIKGDKDLNIYNGVSNELPVCIYQLTDNDSFYTNLQTESGIGTLLTCSQFSAEEVASHKRYLLQPADLKNDSTINEIMTMAESAIHLAVVANFKKKSEVKKYIKIIDLPNQKHLDPYSAGQYNIDIQFKKDDISKFEIIPPNEYAYQTILRLHGSNTIGSKLAPEIIRAFFYKLGAEKVFYESGLKPYEKLILGKFGNQTLAVQILASNSPTAFDSLYLGHCDIGMSSMPIPKNEIEKLKHIGNMKSSLCEYVIGLDGIAVIVNNDNPAFKMDIKELQSIFQQEIIKWSELNSMLDDKYIHLCLRNKTSGTFKTFMERIIPIGEPNVLIKKKLRRVLWFEDSDALSDYVLLHRNAIGFVALPFAGNNKKIKIISRKNYLEPTVFSIKSEKYFLYRKLYFYKSKKSRSHIINQFIQFVLSDNGQKVVNDSGFIDCRIELISPNISHNLPDKYDEYKEIIMNAKKVSLSFPYKKLTEQFKKDYKADIRRIVDFFSHSKETLHREFIVFGFSSDDKGNTRVNQRISRRMALVIADELRTFGIEPAIVKGFGFANPVRSIMSNDNSVEIWVR